VGPFSYAELKHFFDDGALTTATWVWNEEMDDWKVISEYTELATALTPNRFRRGSCFGKTVAAPSGSGGGGGDAAAADPPAAPSEAEQAQAEAEKDKADAAKRRSRALTESRSFFVKNSKAPPAKNDMMKLSTLSQKKYADQAQWFLNAYWKADEITFSEHPDECEHVWTWAANMTKLDKKDGENGSALEEFEAHLFLEKNVKAITVTKMRKVLRDIDIDFDGKVSLTEALIYFYKIDYKVRSELPRRRVYSCIHASSFFSLCACAIAG